MRAHVHLGFYCPIARSFWGTVNLHFFVLSGCQVIIWKTFLCFIHMECTNLSYNEHAAAKERFTPNTRAQWDIMLILDISK